MDPNSPSNTDGVDIAIAEEREAIVKECFAFLGSMSKKNMEPNGASFVSFPHLALGKLLI
jgi:hypothetical protein